VVLFSDGETFDDDLGPILNRTREEKVRIYSVGIGSRKGGLIPIRNRVGEVVDFVKDENGTDALSKLAPALLEQVATATEGKFYLASSGGQALSNLVEDITGLQKAELEGKLVTRYEDRFQIPLLIALFFFMLEFILTDIRGRAWWREMVR
jgi:Ca-activated chloride channel family protein